MAPLHSQQKLLGALFIVFSGFKGLVKINILSVLQKLFFIVLVFFYILDRSFFFVRTLLSDVTLFSTLS